MNRRLFLSRTSVASVGIVAGAAIPVSLSAQSVELLPAETKALRTFEKEVKQAFQDHSIRGNQMAFKIASPSKIISRKETKNGFELKFKNRTGSYITLKNNKGISTVSIMNAA